MKVNLDVNDADLRKFVKEQISAAIVGISRDEMKALVDEQMKKSVDNFPAKIDGILREIITYALRYSGYINSYSNIGDIFKKDVADLIAEKVTPIIEERLKNDSWVDSLIEKEVKDAVSERVDKLMTITK
jgi:hypothetical protein